MAEEAKQEETRKPNMIAIAKCYVNERIYEPGEKFYFDGPESRAFHKIGGKPLTKFNFDALMNKAAAAERAQGDSALLAEVLKASSAKDEQIAEQAGQIVALQEAVAELQKKVK